MCQAHPGGHYGERKHQAHPHNRLHIYNFRSPRTERVDKSLDPNSYSANWFNIVQTCSKREKTKAMNEKKVYDYEGDKNAIAVRFLEGKEDQDKVMELSFHFGQEVEDRFLKKFARFYELLKKPEDPDFSPEKLEIVYGFSRNIEPVIFQVWKTKFALDGAETRAKLFEDQKGEEAGLEYFLSSKNSTGTPDQKIDVRIDLTLGNRPEQKLFEVQGEKEIFWADSNRQER